MKTSKIVGIYVWYQEAIKDRCETLEKLSAKLQWTLRRNIILMRPIAEPFLKKKNELEQQIIDEFASDEYSEVASDNTRSIKPEYMDAYHQRFEDMKNTLAPLLEEDVDVELRTLDLDNEIIDSFTDSKPTIDDINMLELLLFMDVNHDA